MKKRLILLISICLPLFVYAQECCSVYLHMRGTIESDDLRIKKISLPTVYTFDIKDVDNKNSTYSDLFVTRKGKEFKSLSSSLGSYCDSFDLDQFISSLEYFYVIIEAMDKDGNLRFFKKRFDLSKIGFKTEDPIATIIIPTISL